MASGRVGDRVRLWVGKDASIDVKLRIGGKVNINGYEKDNMVNYSLPVSMLNLLMLVGCTQTRPCSAVKAAGLYDTNGNLIKTLNYTSWNERVDQFTHNLSFLFYDTSSDEYTVRYAILYGLFTGVPDDPSNYIILCKTQLDNPVSKSSDASLALSWTISVDRSADWTKFGFMSGFIREWVNALLNGYGTLAPASYNLDLIDAQGGFIKTLPYTEGPYQDSQPSGYRVSVAFDDTSTQTYLAKGFTLFAMKQGQRNDVSNYYSGEGLGKGSTPIRIWYRIYMYYDFDDTSPGVRSNWG